MPKVMTELKCPTCGCYERYIRKGAKWGDCVDCTKRRNARRSNGNWTWSKPHDSRPRCICGVLLDYPTVPTGDGKRCGYCVEEAAEKEREDDEIRFII